MITKGDTGYLLIEKCNCEVENCKELLIITLPSEGYKNKYMICIENENQTGDSLWLSRERMIDLRDEIDFLLKVEFGENPDLSCDICGNKF